MPDTMSAALTRTTSIRRYRLAEAMASGLPRGSHRPDTWGLGQRGGRKGRESEGQTREGGARAHPAKIGFPRRLATDSTHPSRIEPDVHRKHGGRQTRT